MIEQIDIWGNSVPIEKTKISKSGRKRYKKMQEVYGTLEGKTCKTCKNCICYSYYKKRWYKCQKWIVSNSSATDIRLKNTACKKYEEDNEVI